MLRLMAAFGAVLLWAQSGVAQSGWSNIAMISSTMGVSESRLCIGEGTRGDVGCPTYAPRVDSTGLLLTAGISATAPISVVSTRLTGYDPHFLLQAAKGTAQAATFEMRRGSTSYQNFLSFTNSSSTDSDGFIGVMPNQTKSVFIITENGIPARAALGVNSNNGVVIGTVGTLSLGGYAARFTPGGAGYISASLGIAVVTPTAALHVSGTLRLADGNEACDANRTGAIRYTGGDFHFCRNGTTWESLSSTVEGSPDMITSGTTSLVAVSSTGFVNLTQMGTNTAWFEPQRGLVTLGVSATGTISGSTGYFSGNVGIGTAGAVVSTSRLRIFSNGSAHDKLLEITGAGVVGGQAGPFYGLFINPTSNNNATGRYGIYSLARGGGTGPSYGLFAEAEMGSSGRAAAGVYGKVIVNAGATNNNPVLPSAVAGVIAIASTTNTSMVADTAALIARNESFYGDESYGAYIDALAGPTKVIPLRVDYNTAEVMRITSAGSMGLGRNSPTARLDVNGTLRLASGGEACDANRTGAIRYTGGEFSFCRNGSAWESLSSIVQGTADRITSGTTSLVAISNTGFISLTQAGTNTGWFDPQRGLVTLGVSATGTISGSTGFFGGNVGVGIAPQSSASLTLYIPTDQGNLFAIRNQDRTLISITSVGSGNHQYAKMIFEGSTDISGAGRGVGGFIEGNSINDINWAGSAALTFNATRNGAAFTAGNLFVWNENGAPKMTLDHAGLLGLGITQPSASLHTAGTLRISSGGEACDANRTGAIRYTGGEFSFCRNGTAWESLSSIVQGTADRITSGTTSLVAVSNTGFISLTQAGTNTGWFDPQRGLVTLGVSATGRISASDAFVAGRAGVGTAAPSATLDVSGTMRASTADAASCNANTCGSIRRNPATNLLQVCMCR